MLLAQLDSVVAQYAPAAKGSYIAFGKFFTLNPGRADRSVGSFCITMGGEKAGSWVDYAVGDVPGQGYGDVLDLIALSLGCDMKAALSEARTFLGLQTASPADRARRLAAAEDAKRRRKEQEIRDQDRKTRRSKAAVALWLGGREQLRGTPVDYYLRNQRGLDLNRLGRQPGVLRYVPVCKYYREDDQTGEVIETTYPAMVALITNKAGQNVAVHRTYLALDEHGRWDKAPVPDPKKVLGEFSGASIHLWKGIGPRGGKPVGLRYAPAGTRVLIAEGIEDALSAVFLMPHERVLAAISISNLGNVVLPATVTDVTLLADLDENDTARAQLDRAVKAHQDAGRTVRVFQNKWGGKDLNDALRAAQSQEGAA